MVSKHVMAKIYSTTIQPCIDYGISVRGQTNDFTKNENTNTKLCSQTGNKQFIDFTHSRSADIIKCLNWMTVRQRLCILL